MDKKVFWGFFLLVISGFLGGVFSDHFLRPSFAALGAYLYSGLSNFVDENGQRRMDMGILNGQPIQDIYGKDGSSLRMQFATYDGSVRADEKGLPCFTLYDNKGNLKMVFRLDGPNQGPLIIMKDNTGTNRMILGLDIWDKAEEPFLVTWDKDGKQHNVFGNFVMKPL